MVLAAATLALGAAACGGDTTGGDTTGGDASAGASAAASAAPTKDALGTPVTVFAAASLTETFTQLADQFEAAHPGAAV